MVFAVSPVRLLEKLPVPLPSVVWLSAIVGLAVVLQHIPLAVTLAPPLEVTLPPLVAVVKVMSVTEVVVTVASIGDVVNDNWFPYEVPLLLVAYALT